MSVLFGDAEQQSTCIRYSHRMVSCELGRLLGWLVDDALRSFVVDALEPGATYTQRHMHKHITLWLCDKESVS